MSKSDSTVFKAVIAEARLQIDRAKNRAKAIELLALTLEDDTVAEKIYNLATEIREITKTRRFYG